MRGPLSSLWNSRIIGSYLRFRGALFLAGLLAAGGAAVALRIGGLAGILTLSGMIFFTLIGLSVAFKVR